MAPDSVLDSFLLLSLCHLRDPPSEPLLAVPPASQSSCVPTLHETVSPDCVLQSLCRVLGPALSMGTNQV